MIRHVGADMAMAVAGGAMLLPDSPNGAGDEDDSGARARAAGQRTEVNVVGVVGSRGYWPLSDVTAFVLSLQRTTRIVTGGAVGVDRAAEDAARKRRLSRLIFEPEVEDGDPGYVAAIHARNRRIVQACDRVVAFWDGVSAGTAGVIRLAEAMGKPCHVRSKR